MLISEFVSKLRQDLADPDSSRWTDQVLTRCTERGLQKLSIDLGQSYAFQDATTMPDLPSRRLYMLALISQAFACQVQQTATASSFNFQSADKRVEKEAVPRRWSELYESLLAQYQEAVRVENPNASDENILRPAAVGALYEQGICIDYGLVDPDREKLGRRFGF